MDGEDFVPGLRAGLGGVTEDDPAAVTGVTAPAVPVAVAPVAEPGPDLEPTPEEEAAAVRRSRSLGPRPRLLDRQVPPVEAPDLAAVGSAGAQSAVQGVGAAAAGVPMAAGNAFRGAARNAAALPGQVLAAFDEVDAAEADGREPARGYWQDLYSGATADQRARMREQASAPVSADPAIARAGRALTDAGSAIAEGTDRFARETFPVDPAREGDFSVRTARAVGALPGALAAGAAGGAPGMAAYIGSSTYANTFQDARRRLVEGGSGAEEADQRAADAATANAFLQAGLMTVPFVRLLDRLGPAVHSGFLSTLRQMAESGAEFSGSNAVGRVLENYLAQQGYEPDRSLWQGVEEGLGPEAVAGALIPGAGAAARAVAGAGRRASASEGVRRGAVDLEQAFRDARERPGAESRAAVEDAVGRFAQEIGLPDNVRVRLTDRLVAPDGGALDARFEPSQRMVEIALDTDPGLAASRVFHEGAGHAVLSLLPGRERGALERAADRWLAQPADAGQQRPGADPGSARTNRDYIARLNGFDMATPEGRIAAREEAIAHLAEQHLARSLEERPGVTRALDRIVDTMGRLGNAFRGFGFNSAESTFRRMTSGQGVEAALGDPGARVLEAPGGEAMASRRDRPRLEAWHGTHAIFTPEADAPLGRFSDDRIGTGEGRQAFGHGHYFAEARPVAEGYRREGVARHGVPGIEADPAAISVEAVRWPEWPAARREAALAAIRSDVLDAFRHGDAVSQAEVARRMEWLSRNSEDSAARDAAADARWLLRSEGVGALLRTPKRPKGALYRVDLGVDRGDLLSLDEPLEQQPAALRERVQPLADTAGARWEDLAPDESQGRRFMRSVLRTPDGRTIAEVGLGEGEASGLASLSGGGPPEVIGSLAEGRAAVERMLQSQPVTGAMVRDRAGGTPAERAAALEAAGVPGLRYRDRLSRNAPTRDGVGTTENFVMFSGAPVEILGRYSRRERRAPIEGVATVDAGSWRPEGADIRERRQDAQRFLQGLRDEVNARGGIPADALKGARVLMAGRGIKKVISHAGDDALDALPAVADVIRHGSLWGSAAGRDPGTLAMHTVVANVRVGDQVEPMRVEIREAPDGRFFYDFGTVRGRDPDRPLSDVSSTESRAADKGAREAGGPASDADMGAGGTDGKRRGYRDGGEVEGGSAIDAAASRAVAPASEAQAEAGNYRKGHVRLHGMRVAIETPRGAVRSGVGADGEPWSVQMPAHYGYVKGTRGKDGDAVDVYLGPEPDHPARPVYVVDQVDADSGRFDEHKALMGYPSRAAAVEAYDAAFSDGNGPQRRAAVTPMSVADFRRWLDSGRPERGPLNRRGVAAHRRRLRKAEAPPEGRASGGRVGARAPVCMADGGSVGMEGAGAAGVPPSPVPPSAVPPSQSLIPQAGLAPAPNLGGGTADPETRGALQGLQMWKAATAAMGAGA